MGTRKEAWQGAGRLAWMQKHNMSFLAWLVTALSAYIFSAGVPDKAVSLRGVTLTHAEHAMATHEYLVSGHLSECTEEQQHTNSENCSEQSSHWLLMGEEKKPAALEKQQADERAAGPGVSQLRILLGDGSVVNKVFDARMKLQLVADLVASQRAADAGPFALRVANPIRQFTTAEDLQVSFRAAGLEPRGTIVVA